MGFKFHGNTITDCQVGISLPANWSGDAEFTMNRFERVGRVIEFRDEQQNVQTVEVPREIARLVLDTLERNREKPSPEIVEQVAQEEPVRNFLRSHGWDAASLAVGVASLIQAIIQASS